MEAARAFESEGLRIEAADAYGQAGLWGEAGRVLLEDRRYREAGDAWMHLLPAAPTPVTALPSEARRAAIQAALAYARAGEVPLAVGILLNVGDRERAADILNRNQRRDDAVRVLRGEPFAENPFAPGVLSRSPRAAAARPTDEGLERAERLLTLGRFADALAELMKIRPEDPRYVPAVHKAVAALTEPGQIDFAVDRWLSPFLRRPKHGRSDLAVLYALGGFYDEIDFVEGAEMAWKAICAVDPEYRDAGMRLRELGRRQRADLQAVDRIVREEESFRNADAPRRRTVAGEPEPVSLPSLPHVGGAVDQRGGRAAPPGTRPIGPHDPTRGPREALDFQPMVGGSTGAPATGRAATGAFGFGEEVRGTGLLGGGGRAGKAQEPPGFDPFDPFAAPAPGPTQRIPARDPEPVYGLPPRPPPRRSEPAAPMPPPPSQAARSVDPPGRVRAPARALDTLDDPRPRKPPGPESSGYFDGAVLSERYLIEKKLGEGGMAMVFRVRDLVLEETVALKLFRKATQDPTGAERFKQEMKICRRLNHPNIVRTFEFGVWQDAYFLTMEYLDGRDLDALIGKKSQGLPVRQGVDLLRQACDGLQAAHDEGIAHRDVKPQNMFVVGDKLKVMDFGIAKAMDAGVSQTAAGMVVGTPAYLSPERLEGKAGDGISSDLYALGIVMFQVLTGVLPFRGPDIPAMFMQHMGERPEPPSKRNAQVPKGLERICLRLLEKKPRDRYGSAREVREELDALRGTLR